MVNTLSVAALAASLATLLGVLAALCLKRTEFPGRQLLHASLYVLTVSPEMVMGISLLIFFISVKLPLGFVSMLIAHTTLGLPFVALTVLARLAEFDEHLVEAARAAIRAAGLEPEEVPVRGGTDGAVLSWKGLPCPNLGTGGFNFHGVLECITAERMDKATEVILNIVGLYARDPA